MWAELSTLSQAASTCTSLALRPTLHLATKIRAFACGIPKRRTLSLKFKMLTATLLHVFVWLQTRTTSSLPQRTILSRSGTLESKSFSRHLSTNSSSWAPTTRDSVSHPIASTLFVDRSMAMSFTTISSKVSVSTLLAASTEAKLLLSNGSPRLSATSRLPLSMTLVVLSCGLPEKLIPILNLV